MDKALRSEPWRAEPDGFYWIATQAGTAELTTDRRTQLDDNLHATGNYFATRKQAMYKALK